MRIVSTVLLAVTVIVGLAGLALAAAVHELTVQGPGGAVAHVRYTGNIAPNVTFNQGWVNPFAVSLWGEPSPFAELDRITALMDREMAQTIYQARMQEHQSLGSPHSEAMLKDGAASYSFVSMTSGNGFCMQTTQITSSLNGGKPRVVSQTSGDCDGHSNAAAPAQLKGAQPQLKTISYKPEHPDSQPRRGI